jgi:hypothetical protein
LLEWFTRLEMTRRRIVNQSSITTRAVEVLRRIRRDGSVRVGRSSTGGAQREYETGSEDDMIRVLWRAAALVVPKGSTTLTNINLRKVQMSRKLVLVHLAALIALAFTSVAAVADEHPYSEGPVVNISRIRTADGHFEEYLKFVSTKWKQEQELAKKAGDVLSYEVIAVEPRTPDEPDLLLVVYYKNWAALDGSIAKSDAIAKAVDGSIAAAEKGDADRASVRRILGSYTAQVLNLK